MSEPLTETCTLSNTVHLEKGRCNDVAFVFSCPGRKEETAHPPGPAKGNTGKNLDYLLCIMREEHCCSVRRISTPDAFCRGGIWVTNAWDQVEYVRKNECGDKIGRSEPRRGQVLCEENLQRLNRELSCIKNAIICSGDIAQLAVCHLLRGGSRIACTVGVFFVPHLGNRSLNSKYPTSILQGVAETQASTPRQKRIKLVAQDLHDQIDAWSIAHEALGRS